MLVTCHTPDCGNADIAILLEFVDPDTGATMTPDHVLCGVCGQAITDVTDVAPYDGGATVG